MWHLQGILLYRSIEHRNETSRQHDGVRDELMTSYEYLIRDPRVNPEAAKKIAA
jgi:hypothetical protein